jgi:lysyl-tRNA synthetase class 2
MIKDRPIIELISDPNWTEISTAGRVLSFSKLGNISFGKIIDATGEFQFSLKKQTLGENYKIICSSITRGKHIAITGNRWTTGSGQDTIDVVSLAVVQKAHSGMIGAWEGLNDPEKVYRARYREVSVDTEAAKVFLTRSKIVSFLRRYLEDEGCVEFSTPVLTKAACGAAAKPFVTHSNFFDKDYYLRIAPEIYLKTLLGAGFDNVFEIGPSYRNESCDRSHQSEFTSLEFYRAYTDYQDNKAFFLKMLEGLLMRLGHYDLKTEYDGIALDWNNIPTVLYRDLFTQHNLPSPDSLEPSVADELFKKTIRPTIQQPTIIEDYPARMSPLAARKDGDDSTAAQWQLVVCGLEIVKCYSEQVSPVLQRQILEDQMTQRANGDEEAMMIDEDFLDALNYGIPICSGLGCGIDRLVAILTDKRNIRDVIFFPMMG